MADKSDKWIELASNDQGTWSPPGGQIAYLECEVFKHARKPSRYRARCDDRWGNNQGYFQCNGGSLREYRADSLDELMRVAIAGEQRVLSDEYSGRMAAAIRNAIAEAEDAEEDAEDAAATA